MQGKALVVNPAVIHPSATPTIVVGRAREKARKCRAFEIENLKWTRTRTNNHQLQSEPNGTLCACGTLITVNGMSQICQSHHTTVSRRRTAATIAGRSRLTPESESSFRSRLQSVAKPCSRAPQRPHCPMPAQPLQSHRHASTRRRESPSTSPKQKQRQSASRRHESLR